MRKIRNAVVVIILCIIGSYSVMKKQAPVLNMPSGDELQDAVKNSGVRGGNRGPLNFRSGGDDQLKDSVAGNPINAGNSIQDGNGDGGVNPPPRGSGNGGIGPLGGPGNGQNLPPNEPPPLSPSGPQTEEQCSDCYEQPR